jgi:hypothetical protein
MRPLYLSVRPLYLSEWTGQDQVCPSRREWHCSVDWTRQSKIQVGPWIFPNLDCVPFADLFISVHNRDPYLQRTWNHGVTEIESTFLVGVFCLKS